MPATMALQSEEKTRYKQSLMEENSLVLGLPFFKGSKEEVRKKIISLSQNGTGGSVLFANAHVVVESHNNSVLKEKLSRATLIVPDGVPIAWVMNSLYSQKTERYSGPDLMVDLFNLTQGSKHFFLGSSEETLLKIQKKFPGNAVGYYSPPFAKEFNEEEISEQLKIIALANPDYVWVGLGAPKQEKYVIEMAHRYPKAVWLAVGAAFDFYAGNKPRAPKILQRLGLEWAYRLATEPRRLGMRYFKTNPVFIKLALVEIARNK